MSINASLPRLSTTQAGILSLVTVLFSAYVLDPTAPDRPAILALPAVIIGGIAFVHALRDQSAPVFRVAEIQPIRIRRLPLIGGLLLLAILAEINGNLLHIEAFQQVSSNGQFILLCVGIPLMIWGLVGELPRIHRRDVLTSSTLLVLLITALALALRLWQLGNAIHMFVDEVNFTNIIMRCVREENLPLLLRSDHMYHNFPHLFAYLQWGGVNLLGHTLAGIRLPSAIFGTLTVPAVYLLGRNLFNTKVGLLAALLLATYPPHLQFSRLGLNNIADPLFAVLAVAFLARGLHQGKQRDYVLGGLTFGLTQYFYEGGRLLFLALILLWIGLSWRKWRFSKRGLGLFFLTASLMAAPVYYAWTVQGLLIVPRLSAMSMVGRSLSPHLLETLLVYVYLPERPGVVFYYGGRAALILPILIPLFLLGLFYVLGGIRQTPAGVVLGLWLLLTSLGTSLLFDPLIYARYVVVFPALVLILAVGLVYGLFGIKPLSLIPASARPWLIGLIVVLIATGQTIYYFRPQLGTFNIQLRQLITRRDEDDALFRAVHFPADTQIHFISSYPPDENNILFKSDFLFGHPLPVSLILRDELTDAFLAALPRDVDQAFFIDAGDEETLAMLKKHFDLEVGEASHPSVPYPDRYDLYIARAEK